MPSIVTWLLQRVARAVEARVVSAELLTDLQTAISEARARLSHERHALAGQELAERFSLSVDTLQEWLAALERQPKRSESLAITRQMSEASRPILAGRSVGRSSHSEVRPEDRLPGRANEVNGLLSLHDVG